MADERNYYVICENNCKFPAMTKEQTLTAIKQAVETGEIQNVDAGFVTKLQEQNTRSGLSFWLGTQAEYNAIAEPVKDCFYIITDDNADDALFETIERLREDVSAAVAAVDEKLSATNAVLYNGEQIPFGDTSGKNIILPKDLKNYSALKVGHLNGGVLCSVNWYEPFDMIEVSGLGFGGAVDGSSALSVTGVRLTFVHADGGYELSQNKSAYYTVGADGNTYTPYHITKIVGII